MGKAVEQGLLRCDFVQLRDFADPPHFKVDDYPYGKRTGMLLRADVISRAIRSIEGYEGYKLIYSCPKGQSFTQSRARELKKHRGLIFLCGYYEGIDDRVFDIFDCERFSVGDFIVSSGELPSLLMADAIARCHDGVIGNAESVEDDSIVSGVLECPQYTAPREIEGCLVPEVLVSGHHGKIKEWQRKESLKTTLFNQPDLLGTAELSKNDRILLESVVSDHIDLEE